MLRLVIVGLYSLLLSSLAETVMVLCLYATRSVDTTISASLILSFVSVSLPSPWHVLSTINLWLTVTTITSVPASTLVARSPPETGYHIRLSPLELELYLQVLSTSTHHALDGRCSSWRDYRCEATKMSTWACKSELLADWLNLSIASSDRGHGCRGIVSSGRCQ